MDEERVLQLVFMGAFVLILVSALFVRRRGGSVSGNDDGGDGDGGGDGD
jgi:hypothetical protein